AAEYREWVNGISYYQFLVKCEKNFDKMADEIIKNLTNLVHILFRPENLIVGVTCELAAFNIVDHELEMFVDHLDSEFIDVKEVEVELASKNEGFMTSGKIQYVAKAGNYLAAGFPYTGALRVLQTILSLDYLWHNVRVKGGAYGCMASFKRNGSMYFVSYRDPNLKETLEIYGNMHSYISTFSGDEREMRKYIIGTISKLDAPLTASMKNDRMLSLYFSNVSHQQLQLERDDVLNTTPETVRKLAELIKETLKQEHICVIGNENKVNEEKELFEETSHLFN
ncbi:MAG: insulinase family protein, partial [Vallitaleaceae bacterium]|nr:insulinase family protein [Vallitaleaceae bacterium]